MVRPSSIAAAFVALTVTLGARAQTPAPHDHGAPTHRLGAVHPMEALVARWPDDVAARIFCALALGQTALPTDKTCVNQLEAAAILEAEFARQSEHPGLAHYIIHSFDVPPLASRGLNAARRYSAIADAPHALHMPSHTFTRLGLWHDSIDANLKSAAAARRDPGAASEELHALD